MRKIIILFLLILSIPNIFSSFYLERDGWCVDMPTPFTVYNQTQWNNREEIEDDDDLNFSKLSITVTVYDGPFKDEDNIYFEEEFKKVELPSFEINFDREGIFLIEIYETNNKSNDYEEEIDILECRRNYVAPEIKYNYSLEIKNELEVTLINTLIEDSNSISLKIEEMMNFENIEDISKIFTINSSEELSGNLSFKIKLDDSNLNNSLVKYNKNTKKFENVENFMIKNEKIILNNTQFGTYGILSKEIITGIEEEEVVEEKLSEEEIEAQKQLEEEEKLLQQQREEEIKAQKEEIEAISEDLELESNPLKDYSKVLIIGSIIVLVLIFSPKLFKSKTDKQAYHEERNKKTKNQITTYKEAYYKTKEYVQKHKTKFSRDSIQAALKSSNIPDEIIQIVFDEEY